MLCVFESKPRLFFFSRYRTVIVLPRIVETLKVQIYIYYNRRGKKLSMAIGNVTQQLQSYTIDATNHLAFLVPSHRKSTPERAKTRRSQLRLTSLRKTS